MHWRIIEHQMEFSWLFMAVFTVYILLDVIHLVKLISRSREREPHGEPPIQILKKRYANG